MDKRFFNLFNLTEDQAIAVLDTPHDQLDQKDSRYIAASHLVNFPTERSIQALLRAVALTEPELSNRIVRRKSIETLGRLKAKQALPVIQACLTDDDRFTVENTVWAIGEIGTQDPVILAAIAQLLDQPGQTYRVIIQTLAKLNYAPALAKIRQFVDYSEPPVASAALTAVSQLTGDRQLMADVITFLQHPVAMARRLAIQDFIDAQYYEAIPAIAQCPVSLVFRLRGLRELAKVAIAANALTVADVQPYLERTLRDHPQDLALIRPYEQSPKLPFLVKELYSTDFGRCYFATALILQDYANDIQTVAEALLTTYEAEGRNDYGAHFHIIKLLGWLKYAPAYNILIEALHNRQPQFQKSRAAAAIALAELGDRRAIDDLKQCLDTSIWDLQYAALMALQQLGDANGTQQGSENQDWLIQTKINLITKESSR
ncbi:MAG: HEAT repeat domain-containing protein [Cyanobacteria bacterium P01_A01_bin.123]